MKFTLNWLKEFLDLSEKYNIDDICNCLTEIGLEVEGVEDKAKSLSSFKTVEIISFKKHPNADKLNICQVATEDGNLEIVCGANNVRAGLKTVLAKIGSVIPSNQMEIKKNKIRGIVSNGMLCSAGELGIAEDDDGIMDLPQKTRIGDQVANVFNISDPMIEIAITPNRGDCLGVYGIARELAASNIGKLKNISVNYKTNFKSKFTSKIRNKACSSLNFIEIKNLKTLSSPKWLKDRLEAIGKKPFDNVAIDVTNYIAYCFAQPMHSYDVDLLNSQEIIADLAKDNQEFLALDDKKYILQKNDLVIQNGNNIALAGIMGGKSTSCSDKTTNILLEAGNFDAVSIANTGRRLFLDSDSRHRFERKIDADFILIVLQYTALLIQEICDGEVSNIICANDNKTEIREASLSYQKLEQIAGYQIVEKEIKDIFIKLGFLIKNSDKNKITVKIPSWRNDVFIEEDLIEEILRISGFSKIPYQDFAKLNKKEYNYWDLDKELSLKKISSCLGLNEVVTWSFLSDGQADSFGLGKDLRVLNPINKEMSIMRESLIPNLIDIAIREQNRSEDSTYIFELGKVFFSCLAKDQKKNLAGLRIGNRVDKEINNNSSDFDVYDVKNDVFVILENLGIKEANIKLSTDNLAEFLHPKRSMNLYLGKTHLGYFGELNPNVFQKHQKKFKKRANIFEIFLSNLPEKLKKTKKPYYEAELQKIERDFCFIMDKNISAGEVKKEILKINAKLIEKINIFDIYKGDKLANNKKSIAFNVVLQPKEQNLTGKELEDFNLQVINKICQKYSAMLP